MPVNVVRGEVPAFHDLILGGDLGESPWGVTRAPANDFAVIGYVLYQTMEPTKVAISAPVLPVSGISFSYWHSDSKNLSFRVAVIRLVALKNES